MARGENSYLIVPPNENNPKKGEHVVGIKKNAIEFRDKYVPNGQIYLTWSEKTGHTMELIE